MNEDPTLPANNYGKLFIELKGARNVTPTSLVRAFNKSEVARKDILTDLSANIFNQLILDPVVRLSPRLKPSLN